MFEDHIVLGRMWNGTGVLDQYLLADMLWWAKIPGTEDQLLTGRQYKVCFTKAEGLKLPPEDLPDPRFTFSACTLPPAPRCAQWDKGLQQYLQTGTVNRSRDEVFYRISAQRVNNRCFSLCGFSGANEGYASYARNSELGPDGHPKMVCVMPQKQAERMMALHHNCISDMASKREGMLALQVRLAVHPGD